MRPLRINSIYLNNISGKTEKKIQGRIKNVETDLNAHVFVAGADLRVGLGVADGVRGGEEQEGGTSDHWPVEKVPRPPPVLRRLLLEHFHVVSKWIKSQ